MLTPGQGVLVDPRSLALPQSHLDKAVKGLSKLPHSVRYGPAENCEWSVQLVVSKVFGGWPLARSDGQALTPEFLQKGLAT
jgi:hypothetical protein